MKKMMVMTDCPDQKVKVSDEASIKKVTRMMKMMKTHFAKIKG